MKSDKNNKKVKDYSYGERLRKLELTVKVGGLIINKANVAGSQKGQV